MRYLLLVLLVGLGFGLRGQALYTPVPPQSARAMRGLVKSINIKTNALPIKIDGEPDDAAWATADSGGQFIQQFPADTSRARAQTKFRMLSDGRMLYVAVWCYKPVQRTFVQSLRRDFTLKGNDNVAIFIAPFEDGLNGFNFALSPLGNQREALVINGTNSVIIWDQVWYGNSKRHDWGWTAEMAIPLRTLRYVPGRTIWKINLTRTDVAINEQSTWYPVPRNLDLSNLAYSGDAIWESPPEHPHTIAPVPVSVIPYVALRAGTDPENGQATSLKPTVGGDAKIAVTPSLNLDLTVNPDFSNVEADRQQSNLTRFELSYPEQRQFFTENTDLFNQAGFTQIRPFFSRRIGLIYDSKLRQYRQTPILAGARLSGKLDRNWRIGALNMQTGRESYTGLPGQNYTVAVMQRQLFARSNIGAILVNRQFFGQDTGDKARLGQNLYNRVAGLDYNLASADGRWTGKAFYHQSIYEGQKGDDAANASYLQYNSRTLQFMWNHEYVGKNYKADVGFVPRKGYYRLEPEIGYRFYPAWAKRWLLYYEPGLYLDGYADRALKPTDYSAGIYQDFFFTNTGEAHLYINTNYQRLFFAPFDPTQKYDAKTDKLHRLDSASTYRYFVVAANCTSNVRKTFYYTLAGEGGGYYAGHYTKFSGQLGLRATPYGNFTLAVEHDWVSQPYGYNRFMLIGPRAELSFSRSLFFTALVQYNGQAENFATNLRLQWRYRPVSDVFIAYTDNYFTPAYGLRNRGVILKIVYWLNV